MHFREPWSQVYLHLVWATWNRWPMLVPGVREQVFAGLHAQCDGLKVAPLAIGGMEDHVHVLVRIPTSVSIGQLLKQLKGSTSHMINHAGPERHRLRWQGGYGVFSVSRRHVPRIEHYILHQEEHHRAGRLNPSLELIPPA